MYALTFRSSLFILVLGLIGCNSENGKKDEKVEAKQEASLDLEIEEEQTYCSILRDKYDVFVSHVEIPRHRGKIKRIWNAQEQDTFRIGIEDFVQIKHSTGVLYQCIDVFHSHWHDCNDIFDDEYESKLVVGHDTFLLRDLYLQNEFPNRETPFLNYSILDAYSVNSHLILEINQLCDAAEAEPDVKIIVISKEGKLFVLPRLAHLSRYCSAVILRLSDEEINIIFREPYNADTILNYSFDGQTLEKTPYFIRTKDYNKINVEESKWFEPLG